MSDDPDTLVQRAASCLAYCINIPDGDLRSDSEKEFRRCRLLATVGAAGVSLDQFDRLVREWTVNHALWQDEEGRDHIPSAAEIEAVMAKIIQRQN